MRMFTKKTARLRDQARKAARELRLAAPGVDGEDVFPPELWALLWESGFMTMRVPRELGGGGATLPEAVVVVEELAGGLGSAALIVVLQELYLASIRAGASESRIRDLLKRVVDRRETGAFALSEPGDAAVTTARKNKSEFVIRGRKTFVSGGRDADQVLIFAVTNKKAGLKKALTAFLLPAGTPGLLPGLELPRSGLRGLPAVDLILEGCRAPASSRLGPAGKGYEIARNAMVGAAPLAAALSCGLLREALDFTISLARERKTPSPLSEFQAFELALADMSAALDAAVAMTWAAAGAVEEGAPEAERLAREAKWLATESAVTGIDQAARLAGIAGSVRGALLERLARDARAAQLVLGPNHLQRTEVARKLLRRK